MAQAAARRVSKSSVDWATFYQKVPAREREVYRALKNRSDYFVNKVHSNPDTLAKIDFAHYRSVLPGLKMVDEFEKSYASVKVPYPTDSQNMAGKIEAEKKATLTESAKVVKELEHEKGLSALYLRKLDELPPLEDFTLEMMYDYFPWTNLATKPQLFPQGHPDYQPDKLTLNDSRGINNLFKKIGLNVKV